MSACIIYSCANQLPPPGGETDKIPPKIVYVFPKSNTINFRDNVIRIKFDEYIDRRSFEESVSISPLPPGKSKFSWSGNEVEITFTKPLEKNITYIVSVGKGVKDLREGNIRNIVYSFAFSTGSKIDKGVISGRVLNDKYENVKLLAYKINSGKLNPEKDRAGYIISCGDSGNYVFTNLSAGTYRLFAITDEDRNNLFGKDFERISLYADDINIKSDADTVTGINFILENINSEKFGMKFLNSLKPDSSEYVWTNISGIEENISPEYKFYFYFKNKNPDKQEIVNNLLLRDTAEGKSYKLIFNWLSDSLLEVFSAEKFRYSAVLELSLKFNDSGKQKEIIRRFRIIDKGKTGTLEGNVLMSDKIKFPVVLKLIDGKDKNIIYSKKVNDTSVFVFSDIPEGSYILAAFTDENENGIYEEGSYFPYVSPERVFIYGKDLMIKGGWKVDKVFVKF